MRRSVYVEGLGHGDNPIPAAAVVGSLLMSGGISGVERSTGQMPDLLADELANMFDNIEAVLGTVGATVDEVVRLDVSLVAPTARGALNAEWVRRFPEEANRPARKTEVGVALPPGLRVQCTFVAELEGRAQ